MHEHDFHIYTDASAEIAEIEGKLVLRNGFGAIFNKYAIVQDWSTISFILDKLGHFDDKDEKVWSSTKAEQIAALLSLFTFIDA